MSKPFKNLAQSGGNPQGGQKKRQRSNSETQTPLMMMDDPGATLLLIDTTSEKSESESAFKKLKRRLSFGSKDGKSGGHSSKQGHKRTNSDIPAAEPAKRGPLAIPQPVASTPSYSVFTHSPPVLLSSEVDDSYFTPKNVYLNLAAEMRYANEEQSESLKDHRDKTIAALTADVRDLKTRLLSVVQALRAVSLGHVVLIDRQGNHVGSELPPDVATRGCFSCFDSFFGAD